MIHGYPVAVAVFALAVAGLLWHYKKRPGAIAARAIPALAMLAAFMLTAGIGPWTQALASFTASGTGLVVLLVLSIVGALIMWHDVIRRRTYHHVRSPLVALVFGVVVLLVWGGLGRITRLAAKTPGKAGSALAQAMNEIHSGHAAAATSSASHQYGPLIIGALVVAGLGLLMMRLHSGSHGRSRPNGGRPAIGGGAPSGGAQGGPPVKRP